MSKKAVVILNLGTPSGSDPKAVGVYLKEFLMDPKVLDVPYLLRWILVNIFIVPRRKFKSSRAYSEIWQSAGSPLLLNSKKLAFSLGEKLPEKVFLAMRYGEPSILNIFTQIKAEGFDQIDLMPMYPQYALSSTETAILEMQNVVSSLAWRPKVRVLKPFYNNSGYISSLCHRYYEAIKNFNPEHVLFSYHGLPIRHLTKVSRDCMKPGCCEYKSVRSNTCYRYQAYQTSKLIAENLKLTHTKWSVSFQSRLGPGWIQPFTDKLLQELPKKGVQKLLIFSPSFVVDCLETLEEIQKRGSELFIKSGGKELKLVTALNDDPRWVQSLSTFPKQDDMWNEYKI